MRVEQPQLPALGGFVRDAHARGTTVRLPVLNAEPAAMRMIMPVAPSSGETVAIAKTFFDVEEVSVTI